MTSEPPWQREYLQMAAQIAGIEIGGVDLPEERDIVVGGMRLHHIDWGGQAGRQPIVFLHGAGLTAHTWDLVCLALRDRFRCVALDLRGHGDSEWSPNLDYSLEAHSRDVDLTVRELGLRDIVLVGMSLGGLTAIAYAGRHDDLAALVSVDIGPSARPAGSRRVHEFVALAPELDSIDEFVERSLVFNPMRDARLLRHSLQHNLRRLPNGRWTWKYDRRYWERPEFRALDQWRRELWSDVGRVQCPVLVVRVPGATSSPTRTLRNCQDDSRTGVG